MHVETQLDIALLSAAALCFHLLRWDLSVNLQLDDSAILTERQDELQESTCLHLSNTEVIWINTLVGLGMQAQVLMLVGHTLTSWAMPLAPRQFYFLLCVCTRACTRFFKNVKANCFPLSCGCFRHCASVPINNYFVAWCSRRCKNENIAFQKLMSQHSHPRCALDSPKAGF